MYAVRSVWAGLPTLFVEPKRTGDLRLIREKDSDVGLQPSGLPVAAGFALTDPKDPRYEIAVKHRERYGHVVHKAAVALGGNVGGEDHIDAVIGVLKVRLDASIIALANS